MAEDRWLSAYLDYAADVWTAIIRKFPIEAGRAAEVVFQAALKPFHYWRQAETERGEDRGFHEGRAAGEPSGRDNREDAPPSSDPSARAPAAAFTGGNLATVEGSYTDTVAAKDDLKKLGLAWNPQQRRWSGKVDAAKLSALEVLCRAHHLTLKVQKGGNLVQVVP